MNKSSRLVFFGTEDFSQAALERIVSGARSGKARWSLVAVVTKPSSKSGRGLKLREPAVKQVAQAAGLAVFQPQKPDEIIRALARLEPTHGILSAYGKILPQEVIDIFPGGIINLHPSLLPKYRGPSPIETAILNGDKQTGVSIMRLSAGMDEGPVYAQKKIGIPPESDALTFAPYIAGVGADFLMDKLPSILEGSLKPKPQDDAEASYTKLLKKEDGFLDFNKPAEVLEREVRAYLGWPKSLARLFGHSIIVTKARVAESSHDGALLVRCRPGWLEIVELTGPSGKTMSGADYIRGYKKS